jgi:hypothetical protein
MAHAGRRAHPHLEWSAAVFNTATQDEIVSKRT